MLCFTTLLACINLIISEKVYYASAFVAVIKVTTDNPKSRATAAAKLESSKAMTTCGGTARRRRRRTIDDDIGTVIDSSSSSSNCRHDAAADLLLARKIKTTSDTNISHCLKLLEERVTSVSSFPESHLAALEVCTRAAAAGSAAITTTDSKSSTSITNVAINLYQKCPTEACRTKAIQVCGRAGQWELALQLLQRQRQEDTSNGVATIDINDNDDRSLSRIGISPSPAPPKPSAASYNAAIAACAHAPRRNHNNSSSQNTSASALCCWEQALQILRHDMPEEYRTTLTCNAVLTVLEKNKRPAEALELLESMMMMKMMTAATITGLPSSCEDNDSSGPGSSVAVHGAHSVSEKDYVQKFPPPDRVSFHKVIKTLTTAANITKNGDNNNNQFLERAYQLIPHMIQSNISPNQNTYDLLVRGFGRVGNWTMVHYLESLRSKPSAELFLAIKKKTVTTSVSQRNNNYDDDTAIGNKISTDDAFFAPWPDSADAGMIKHGKGKFAYWEIGQYTEETRITNDNSTSTGGQNTTINSISMTVALQPHRNPAKNGIKLLLLDNHDGEPTKKKKKAGFLLMINSHSATKTHEQNRPQNNGRISSKSGSKLLGVCLDKAYRKQGLSKVLLAIWIDLCLSSGLAPVTGIINKPLLALVLQHTFGFVPTDSSGVDVEIGRGHNGSSTINDSSAGNSGTTVVELYSSHLKSLHGAFSEKDQRRENIRLLKEAPAAHRKRPPCRIGASLHYVPPPPTAATTTTPNTKNSNNGCELALLAETVRRQLRGRSRSGRLEYTSSEVNWPPVLLGQSTVD